MGKFQSAKIEQRLEITAAAKFKIIHKSMLRICIMYYVHVCINCAFNLYKYCTCVKGRQIMVHRVSNSNPNVST